MWDRLVDSEALGHIGAGDRPAELPARRAPHQRRAWPKVLIAMAHPDDEYALAATVYRISRELGGVADHIVITNGEGGYRYASLAEAIYGVAIAREPDGRTNLPAIRRQETVNAGRILGVRHHHFLEQPDSGFECACADAEWRHWDLPRVREEIAGLLAREAYDFVFILLPREGIHGHHSAVALLVLEAVADLSEDRRPVVLGVEDGRTDEQPCGFSGLGEYAAAAAGPVFSFDRNTRFGHQAALSYQIVANWVMAEHKSQGLFQTDYGKYDAERFWAFAVTPRAWERASELGRGLLRPEDPLDGFCPSS
jgi:LmbE family N-acetylglucosaminyl deacetylase